MDSLIQDYISSLVDIRDGIPDDSCPICLVAFSECEGVTKLEHCGHVFCRTDLVEWITGRHGTCPTCRQPFLDIRPYSESDDESSDGGEYIPNDDEDEDEDDGFLDTDGFTSEPEELDIDPMDVSFEEDWEAQNDEDWDPTDSSSEADLDMVSDSIQIDIETGRNSSSSDLSEEEHKQDEF